VNELVSLGVSCKISVPQLSAHPLGGLKINKEIQMSQRRIRGKVVGNMTIVLAIILLFGVLAMAYGYFQNNMHWIYLGISITIATSFTIMFQTILRPQNWINIRRTKRVQ
jgi:hypothetical protein